MVYFGTWILVAALGLAYAEEEACWETCLRTNDDDRSVYRELYNNIQEIAHEINALKNLYNITKIGFALDTSVSDRHNVPAKDDSSLTEAQIIYRTQAVIVALLSEMIYGQKNYIAQYDETSSWSCDEFNCLDSCMMEANIQPLTSVWSVPSISPTSHCLGNVEAACKLLNNYMTFACDNTNQKTMIIAIVNNDFYLNDHLSRRFDKPRDHHCPPHHWHGVDSSSSDEDHFSPCLAYFDTRYVIGVGNPTKEVMERFISKHGNYRHIHASAVSMTSYNQLFECVNTACCTGTTGDTITKCSKTQGPFGEIISDYNQHPALA